MANKKFVNGILVDMTADDIAQKTADDTTWNNDSLNRALRKVRFERDRLIAETDYLALSDQTLSAEMTTYRQALRDITNGLDTVEKCNNVTWPTKP